MNLVVDVAFGADAKMSPERKAYLEKVSKSVAELREAGIPTVWISISNVSRLHEAAQEWPSPTPEARDPSELRSRDFLDHGADKPVSKENADFLQAFGPKKDEVLFQKAFFDAFTGPQDVDKLKEHLEGQRPDKYAIDIRKAFDGPMLLEYLEKLGVKQITVMGGNSDVCVMSTAMGWALADHHAVILTDHVISGDDQNGQKSARFHEDKIKEKLSKITDRPADLEGNLTHSAYADPSLLSEAEKKKIRGGVEYSEMDAFLSSLPSRRAALASDVAAVPTGVSKFIQPQREVVPATPEQKTGAAARRPSARSFAARP